MPGIMSDYVSDRIPVGGGHSEINLKNISLIFLLLFPFLLLSISRPL